jgi:hypothetical protein
LLSSFSSNFRWWAGVLCLELKAFKDLGSFGEFDF